MDPDRGKYSFPKSARLRHRKDYQSMWKKGRKHYTPHFIFIVCVSDGETRLGVTVSRKVGNAVVRNRVKRQIKEIFRWLRPELAKVDISVVARSSAAQLTSKQLATELRTWFSRCGDM